MIISHASAAGGPPSPFPSIYIRLQPQVPTKMVEEAWRRPTAITGRNTSNGAMLEEMCSIRRRVGLVVTMYLPGHRGMVANEYADAVAKTHAQREVDGDTSHETSRRR